MNYQEIKLEIRDDHLAVLTLANPKVLNAISLIMLSELKYAMGQIENPDNNVRCLLITGEGRGFCSGANLKALNSLGNEANGRLVDQSLDATYNPLFLKLKNLKIPVITAINGPAAGIGMTLALMGDLVVAAKSAYFLQAFRNVGLIPDGGATWLLPRMIGLARAMELSLLAQRLPAEKALDWGLINQVFEDTELISQALELGQNLASGPTVSLGLIRQSYWQSADNSYAEQLHLESGFQQICGASHDAHEGRMAFLEKRKPAFKGK
ncbi:MAG: enoyl-CoA hydratase/isomerase [Deltaproteobacteria bacterium]|nr:enoyl-CoA hydratase/isomerase [Deltaproteobacteria bacterium]